MKYKSITFLSWSSWKSNKDIFLNIFPGQNLRNSIHYEFFDIYMKLKLDYSIFVLHIQFYQDSMEFQVNQEMVHPTLTILKVVLTLKLVGY